MPYLLAGTIDTYGVHAQALRIRRSGGFRMNSMHIFVSPCLYLSRAHPPHRNAHAQSIPQAPSRPPGQQRQRARTVVAVLIVALAYPTQDRFGDPWAAAVLAESRRRGPSVPCALWCEDRPATVERCKLASAHTATPRFSAEHAHETAGRACRNADGLGHEVLAASDACSTYLGPGWVAFTALNRALEEFDFGTVVRTSQPFFRLTAADVRGRRNPPPWARRRKDGLGRRPRALPSRQCPARSHQPCRTCVPGGRHISAALCSGTETSRESM
jgi:hypothetical protein